MSTSGSYNWSLNRDEAILMAFQLINVYNLSQSSVSTNDNNYAIKILNGMLKQWSVENIKVTKRKIGYLFPALLQHKYNLGSVTSSDNCTNTYVSTTLSAAASSSATTLTLTSTTGMTAADYIGIELTSGTRFWTTIVSVDSSTQVTITSGLSGAAASGLTVVSYTSKLNRPLDIIYGSSIDLKNSNTKVQIKCVSHDQYLKMPTPSIVGLPNQMFYDKPLNGSNSYYSNLYLYPEPSDVSKIIEFVYVDAIQDLDGATDDFDLPSEWLYTIVFNLACELCYSYGKFAELPLIKPHADELKDALVLANTDKDPIRIKLKRRY